MLHSHTHSTHIPRRQSGPGHGIDTLDGPGPDLEFPVGKQEGAGPEHLRKLAVHRLLSLIERGGELPDGGRRGVLLPPFDEAFLAAELGCRPSQAASILNDLAMSGTMARDGDRWRVPEVEALHRLRAG